MTTLKQRLHNIFSQLPLTRLRKNSTSSRVHRAHLIGVRSFIADGESLPLSDDMLSLRLITSCIELSPTDLSLDTPADVPISSLSDQ